MHQRLAELGPVLGAHAGGIELVEVAGSTVRLRFTGMCTGCHLRPVTTASTIRPALLALADVETVEIEGSRSLQRQRPGSLRRSSESAEA